MRALQNSKQHLELDKSTRRAQDEGGEPPLFAGVGSGWPTIQFKRPSVSSAAPSIIPSKLLNLIEKSSRTETGNPPPEFCKALLDKPNDALTKHDHFRSMLTTAHTRGANPRG